MPLELPFLRSSAEEIPAFVLPQNEIVFAFVLRTATIVKIR